MSLKEILFNSDHFYCENNLYFQKDIGRDTLFERQYLELREKENRLYPDDIVKRLPEIPVGHKHKSEWAIRQDSIDRLIRYLAGKGNITSILEVGCGNGWLSNRISIETQADVYGVDINEAELRQATRLFGGSKISFIYANVLEPIFQAAKFDAIILASGAQYFSDLKLLIDRLIEFKTWRGEIHILDSPFYTRQDSLKAAQKRSRDYFATFLMTPQPDHYFHHTFDELADFNYSIMYRPESWPVRLQRRILGLPRSPFPWIRINNQ